ncbi:NAD(P)/FAD-dependent oxidoreductase [Candidatus Woesearchaeota archaeon]|nr:MAG: NAD(P)/FAD-dependent oxidoreductase [Candidatus Woesearchaeota archaeon]
MEKNYDVIIVGAGPAGAHCARLLSQQSKLNILVLDRTQEIGEPKKSTAATFESTIKDHNIPSEVIMQKTNEFVIEGPTQEARFSIPGVVLDFHQLKHALIDQAVNNGIDLEIATNVTGPLIENGKVCGVKYHNLEGSGEIRANIIVDASGPEGILARQVGLRKIEAKEHATGMEYELERIDLPEKVMLFRLDQNFAPGGYSWICSLQGHQAKVGNCWYDAYFQSMKGQGSSVAYLHKWMHEDKRLQQTRALEIHAGDAYLTGKLLTRTYPGLICIGDSVCSINPLSGEGIRTGMNSAAFAAEAILNAQGDYSKEKMSAYQKKWNAYAKAWKYSSLMAKVIYQLPNKKLDTLIKVVRQLEVSSMEAIINYRFGIKEMAKLVKPVILNKL